MHPFPSALLSANHLLFLQARAGPTLPNFTPADLVRSVNKRMRQSYLRKRLLTSYKALERMSLSGLNIEKLQDLIEETGKLSPEFSQIVSLRPDVVSGEIKISTSPQLPNNKIRHGLENCKSGNNSSQTTLSSVVSDCAFIKQRRDTNTISSREIERDRGKPLSKYERNVMIFDWLHTLDENAIIDFH